MKHPFAQIVRSFLDTLAFGSAVATSADGPVCLPTECGLLPGVGCCGPGSWASLLVTTQASGSFLQRLHGCFFSQEEPHLSLDVCVHVVWVSPLAVRLLPTSTHGLGY